MRWRIIVIGLAVALAVVPIPPDWVESAYSNGI